MRQDADIWKPEGSLSEWHFQIYQITQLTTLMSSVYFEYIVSSNLLIAWIPYKLNCLQ